ncbi:TonB-dependent receptor [Sphingomonas sp.]|jgi:iron complex outermembrane receptor protein|uniref:TonB-dependent receptor n=1 Tax=Sphingomonas sp. TaxID=28214 RepID=UPI002D7F4D4E|nr:TonB-dependent receptor [Sphingomonas sp.]HEU0043815.1 TonB-dependent receptor [Sphingomonas sp.]
MIRITTRALLIAGASLFATPAMAQETAAQSDSVVQDPQADAGAGIGDIVVTARRREESLLDVPIAVTAFTGAQLEAQGAIDITDISNVTPNVTIEVSRGTNSTLSSFIRGVGQQDPVPGFEAGVGLYLDDVYLNRPQASVLDIYDVERVEVLRGPQGTLYGRNTIGGAIKYVTRRLPDQFEVKARGTYGTYNQLDGILSLSAPVGPFRVGASVAKLTRDGFGKNINLGIDNYEKDVLAARGTIEFTSPDSRLFMRLTGDFTDDTSNARNGHRLIPGFLSGAPVLEDEYDTRAGLNSPRNDVESGGVSLTVNAELSDAFTFRSISAFRKDRSFTPIDFDALPTVDVDVPAVYRNEQTSQEFQLLYESERVNGLVGFYYLDAKAATKFDVILATTGPLIGIPLASGFGQQTAGRVTTDTWSAFADFTFDLTDQFSVSGGLRYTSDDRGSYIFKANRIGGADPEFGGTGTNFGAPITNFRGTAKFEKWTPRASVSFKPTDDVMLYASYSKGFKGGGFDPRGSANVAAIDVNRDKVFSYAEIYDFFLFEPEEVDSYEVGLKGSAANGAVTFALTGFYADYKNVQIPGSIGIDANGDGVFEGFSGVTTNAASAKFKGLELETNARFARGFAGEGSRMTLNGTLGYIDAKYDQFVGNLGTDVSNITDIQNTPTWTASATLGAVASAGDGTLNFSTTVSYRSKTQQFEYPSPYLDQEGYALWDANLVYTFGDSDRFSIGVHAKNILDKRYKTSGYQFLATSPTTGLPIINAAGNPTPSLGREGIATVFYGNPRQVFGTIGLKF